jgi:hypothetical protein
MRYLVICAPKPLPAGSYFFPTIVVDRQNRAAVTSTGRPLQGSVGALLSMRTICSRAKCCYCRLWARQGGIQQREGPMSDRNVVATSVFIAGIILGAFTVQLKDQLSLHLGTSGLNTIMQCAATGP